MRTMRLLGAMFKVGFIYLRRYYFETVSGLTTLLLFFVIIFYGAKAFGGGQPDFGSTLSGIVVGYFVWAFALIAYSSQSQEMIQEAQVGTLEQLAMSPLGLTRVTMANLISTVGIQSIFMSVMLVAMMTVSGKWLNVDLLSVIPILIPTLAGIMGIGFVAGGLAVVYKRVGSLLQILQIAFIALVAVPVSAFSFMKYLPLAWGNHLLQQVMIGGVRIWDLPASDFLFLLVQSALYLLAGAATFRGLEKLARDRALLGHY